MSVERSEFDDKPAASSGGLKPWHFFVIVGLAVAASWWLYVRNDPRGSGGADSLAVTPEVATVPEGSRTVTLFFAREDDTVLFAESRQVAIGETINSQVTQVVRALVEGPSGNNAVSPLPEGTRLLGAFYDNEASALYLDFSGDLIAGHSGGASAEYYTILAIMKTVSENFPEVVSVQLLVDGFQVGTLAGHIDANRPLMVADWR